MNVSPSLVFFIQRVHIVQFAKGKYAFNSAVCFFRLRIRVIQMGFFSFDWMRTGVWVKSVDHDTFFSSLFTLLSFSSFSQCVSS